MTLGIDRPEAELEKHQIVHRLSLTDDPSVPSNEAMANARFDAVSDPAFHQGPEATQAIQMPPPPS